MWRLDEGTEEVSARGICVWETPSPRLAVRWHAGTNLDSIAPRRPGVLTSVLPFASPVAR